VFQCQVVIVIYIHIGFCVMNYMFSVLSHFLLGIKKCLCLAHKIPLLQVSEVLSDIFTVDQLMQVNLRNSRYSGVIVMTDTYHL